MLLVSTYCYLIQQIHVLEQPSADARDWSSPGPSSLLGGPCFQPGRLGPPIDPTDGPASSIDHSQDRNRHIGRGGSHTCLRPQVLDSCHRPGGGRRPASTHRRRTERPLPTRTDPPAIAPPPRTRTQRTGHRGRSHNSPDARPHIGPSAAAIVAPHPSTPSVCLTVEVSGMCCPPTT